MFYDQPPEPLVGVPSVKSCAIAVPGGLVASYPADCARRAGCVSRCWQGLGVQPLRSNQQIYYLDLLRLTLGVPLNISAG